MHKHTHSIGFISFTCLIAYRKMPKLVKIQQNEIYCLRLSARTSNNFEYRGLVPESQDNLEQDRNPGIEKVPGFGTASYKPKFVFYLFDFQTVLKILSQIVLHE